jgi:hypothetical protein
MDARDLVRRKRKAIFRIARRHGVGAVRVFGSFARGEATDKSDLDLLIEVTGPTSPWFPGGLVADLEELLGRRVQVVEPQALREEFGDGILAEAVPL